MKRELYCRSGYRRFVVTFILPDSDVCKADLLYEVAEYRYYSEIDLIICVEVRNAAAVGVTTRLPV